MAIGAMGETFFEGLKGEKEEGGGKKKTLPGDAIIDCKEERISNDRPGGGGGAQYGGKNTSSPTSPDCLFTTVVEGKVPFLVSGGGEKRRRGSLQTKSTGIFFFLGQKSSNTRECPGEGRTENWKKHTLLRKGTYAQTKVSFSGYLEREEKKHNGRRRYERRKRRHVLGDREKSLCLQKGAVAELYI